MKHLLAFVVFLSAWMPTPVCGQASSGFKVGGRVVRSAAAQSGAAQSAIVLTDAASGLEVEAIPVGADGAFQFAKVRPGTYRLQVLRTDSGIVDPVVIAVVDRDVTGIEFRVAAMVDVPWTVAVEGGGLRPTLTVTLAPYRGGQATRSIVLNDAATTRQLPEGEYRVSWNALPAGYEMKSILAGPADVLSGRLKIGGPGTAPPVAITLGVSSPPPWVKVAGRVSAASPGRLPDGMGIVLEDQASGRRTAEAAVGPDGAFEFPMILPGTYRPVVTGGQPAQVLAPPTVVIPGVDLTGVQIAVAPLKRVTGKVAFDGRPPDELPSLLIFVYNRVQSTVVIQPDGTFSMMLAVGRSSFAAVVPGYTVKSLTYGASNLLTEPVTVGLTDTAELQVTLLSTAVLDGPDR
jgi:hypothetical protein